MSDSLVETRPLETEMIGAVAAYGEAVRYAGLDPLTSAAQGEVSDAFERVVTLIIRAELDAVVVTDGQAASENVSEP